MIPALERWLSAEDEAASVPRLRRVFAAVMLTYDVVDLVWGATDYESDWAPHPRTTEIAVLQVGLIACSVAMLLGRRVWIAGVLGAFLRFVETRIFPLNDFHFFAVVTFLLAHGDGGPFGGPKHPRWVRDVLLAQVGFVYVATAWLKLGPAWIDGEGIFVRTTYLREAFGWPYPGFIARLLAQKSFDAWLARLAVAGELALGGMLWLRRPRRVAIALAVAIHAFGTLATNVWFFSAAMIACVACLMPRRTPAKPQVAA
jgi:hypothetical protein